MTNNPSPSGAKVGELRHSTKDTGDCPSWCAACRVEAEQRAALAAVQAPGVGASEDWQHLKQYGYAPGNYLAKCHFCDKVAEFIDKRATCCRPCAEARHAALAAAQPAPAVPWGTGLLAREELALGGHIGAGPSVDAPILATGVPAGFWLAPMEPTGAMVLATMPYARDAPNSRCAWNAMRDEWLRSHPAPASVRVEADAERIANIIIRDVGELGYSSPDEMPNAMLATADELRAIVFAAIAEKGE